MQHLCRRQPDGSTMVYAWFEAMHTRVDLLINSHDQQEKDLFNVADGIRQLITQLEKVGNRFDPTSEISNLNNLAAGEEIKISDTLYKMLSLCLDFNARTKGLFDITVSSPKFQPRMIESIHLGSENTFWRDNDRAQLDLSGFIKGYALDCIRTYLENCNITDALVNLGNSSIMAMGNVPGPVKNGCLTTSGNADASRRHIINPHTGKYIIGQGSAQVFTDSGAEGEVEATVKFIVNSLDS